ncbi:MarR family winged helix-turn-helix transcriptional regulator [Sphingomonas oryzagri]|uniref:MarR family winged helix-turn-helix transcriptional regulator n=1 Tax=Sphingomonas oryzagri TaxID=3042314 RepID=A0ABT6N217_9SPHN|nr:MarR family winged helix-turn-helix transcriptional regulator [Sphingomonas oryzagri]MDH7639222.1 MarR family winged helix-turn-helix transcriptional regulator [Sphingomonas oryzagri]
MENRQNARQPEPLRGEARPAATQAQASSRIAACRDMLERGQIVERVMGQTVAPDAELAMLLYIYLAEAGGREPYLWEVCTATSTPISTAHRKLGRLTEQSLLARTMIATDRRRIGLRLTPKAQELVDRLLDRIVDHGP